MATQLTPRTLKSGVSARFDAVHLSQRALVAICAACVVVAFASLSAATHNAARDRASYEKRYEDTRALLALPPASNESLIEDVNAAKLALATAEAQAQPSTLDAASDDLTSLLVRGTADAGLTVRGVARQDTVQANVGTVAYTVQSLRVIVAGTVGDMKEFLRVLDEQQPSLIASLSTLSVDNGGKAQAEIIFSVYAPVPSPTPAVAPTARPG